MCILLALAFDLLEDRCKAEVTKNKIVLFKLMKQTDADQIQVKIPLPER